MSKVPSIFIESLGNDYLPRIREGLSFIGLGNRIKPGDTVFIKPNLTYPHYKAGVMTSPECIENLIIALKDYSVNIIVGETDSGGYNRFSMDEVFEKTGLRLIAKKHDVKVVNLCKLPSRDIHFMHNQKEFSVPLPQLLLDEVDLSITVPVPKIHMYTGVSMSIKNQWGCISDPAQRLKLHPCFEKIVFEVNKVLNFGVSIIDGRYGLNRSGPLRGDVVDLGWIMITDNILAADMVCTKLMGIKPLSIKYLRFYSENNPLPDPELFRFNQDYSRFSGPPFYLKREFWDYPGYFAFNSSLFAYIAYRSPISKVLHKVLYLFREKFYDHD
jgi:uncharacterized protein (DUF362 family)